MFDIDLEDKDDGDFLRLKDEVFILVLTSDTSSFAGVADAGNCKYNTPKTSLGLLLSEF